MESAFDLLSKSLAGDATFRGALKQLGALFMAQMGRADSGVRAAIPRRQVLRALGIGLAGLTAPPARAIGFGCSKDVCLSDATTNYNSALATCAQTYPHGAGATRSQINAYYTCVSVAQTQYETAKKVCNQIPPCPSGQTCCDIGYLVLTPFGAPPYHDYRCVDLQAGPLACGKCTKSCSPGIGYGPATTCCAGQCCATGQNCCGGVCCTNCCDGKCADSDAANCGKCGNVCASGKCCVDSCCGSTSADAGNFDCCPFDTTLVCTDITNNDVNCGTCGRNCTLTGLSCCSKTCVNKNSNADHCGACGHKCPATRPFCIQGVCSCPTNLGYAVCFDACRKTDSDLHYCGPNCTDCTKWVADPNLTCCFGQCTILGQHDNCSGCGDNCGPAMGCINGTCIDVYYNPHYCANSIQRDCRPNPWDTSICCNGVCCDVQNGLTCVPQYWGQGYGKGWCI